MQKLSEEILKDAVEKLEAIPVGKENAVSRRDLVDLWGMSDRDVRETVRYLRSLTGRHSVGNAFDMAILSSSNHRGYWRSDDQEEIRAYNAEIVSRQNNLVDALQ